ncbi:phenylacrylic acid decarboxylase [Colletotrichum chrysophilum]|uniref:Flavin prenyltransferase PAD1, mitochondrial n=1 Tax=Colletotrichum chrysophilum TaxID=1836956 RepID=A0AAD9ABG6_9PEZI|nr:phenylacrylic acid decarboxylase [Colletotrichum chrysophilum]
MPQRVARVDLRTFKPFTSLRVPNLPTPPQGSSRYFLSTARRQLKVNQGEKKKDIRSLSYAARLTHRNNGSTSQLAPTNDDHTRCVQPRPKRLVVGITGATGTPFAIRLLQILREIGVETHLIMSKWALATLKYETPLSENQIRGLAHTNYTARDMSAPIASGSFQHDGMIIVPCSMKTLAAVRAGFGDDLISRAADVTLKEGRRLTLVVRETPLNDIHLDNMLFLRRAGAVIFPPVPAFYTRPKTLEDIIDQSVGRMLDSLGFHIDNFERWDGFRKD